MRQIKRHFTQHELREMALPVCETILSHPRVKAAGTILAYHSLSDEVDMTAVLQHLLAMGKCVLLPRIISDTEMSIHRYTGEQDLVAEKVYGIMEPCGEPFADYSSINLALIPGMAFDCKHHRLGRGKGYYDRFLAMCPNIYKVGVCFPFQLLDCIPYDEHDILMDEIICE